MWDWWDPRSSGTAGGVRGFLKIQFLWMWPSRSPQASQLASPDGGDVLPGWISVLLGVFRAVVGLGREDC